MPADTNRTGIAQSWVFRFGGGTADGATNMTAQLGPNGANLAGMARLGLPVLPGYTLTAQAGAMLEGVASGRHSDVEAQMTAALAEIGLAVGAQFGDVANPLLVSVNSGAPSAMPGQPDTIQNIGLTDHTVEGLAALTGDVRSAYDSYRRLIATYAITVLGLDPILFEVLIDQFKTAKSVTHDSELMAADLQLLATEFKHIVQRQTGQPFPQDARTQLWDAIQAMLRAWSAATAVDYRKLNAIPDPGGTAVTIQAVIQSTAGKTFGKGTAFTRDPLTGEPVLTGTCTLTRPGPEQQLGTPARFCLTEQARIRDAETETSLEAVLPCVFAQLQKHCNRLEQWHGDLLEIDFAIQESQLWLVRSRSAKRSTNAALRTAVDLAEAGVISRDAAVLRIDARQLDPLLHPTLQPDVEKIILAKGLPSSPGAACGAIVFTSEDAVRLRAQGKDALLVRDEVTPKDFRGMFAAVATLSTRGGLTGHAEMVARGMGRPFVSAARGLHIDQSNGLLVTVGRTFQQGDIITVDGSTGQVLLGRVPLHRPALSGDFAKLMSWADAARRMNIRANAETPRDARQAREFGAEGIGLCRTEHMFFETDRILAMREMILADSEAGRRVALARILPMQRQDFIEMFEIMAGYPVTIRLLDPPLHEFLPSQDTEVGEVAAALDVPVAKIRRRLAELQEVNPMLGLRGCRLGLAYPEITEMQARAIFEAAIAAANATGKPVIPEIMVPLVGFAQELETVKAQIDRTAAAIEAETGVKLLYQVGTMIELPRAALRAGEIARSAEFFSFGTNDLTQTTLGISRDDAAPILANYLSAGIIETDPFLSLDIDGVGELVAMAAERGRKTKPNLKLGLCGEHGGDPRSIAFCEETGLDYVSCSPFRVPVARLAAAHAALARRARNG